MQLNRAVVVIALCLAGCETENPTPAPPFVPDDQSPDDDDEHDETSEPSTDPEGDGDGDDPDDEGPDPDDDGPVRSEGLPCDVAELLHDRCSTCHGATRKFGAPMSLVTYDDLTAPAVSDPDEKVYELVKLRVHTDDPGDIMPPQPNEPLSADELAVLDTWIDAGAPKATDLECGEEPGDDPDGGVDEPGADLSECDYLFELRAHGGTTADDETGFAPPLADDTYECFNFPIPWNEEVHGLRFDALIGDDRTVHHWILYSIDEARPAGSHGCGGTNRTFVSGWAPGKADNEMPEGVGMVLPKGQNATFQLEVHYNNVARYTDISDRSGVRVCATKNLRPNSAAVHWLGSIGIFMFPGKNEVSNTCVPTNTEPVHILSSSPHMHQLGTHMKTVINRADGSQDILVDTPFDFRNQSVYATDQVVQPGDQLVTTCSWDNTTSNIVTFGEGTGDEMCFNFVLAYPVGGLSSQGAGQNRCIGL